MGKRLDRISRWLGWASLVLMILALYGGLVYTPPERVMGQVFRIFYFHVPTAWVAYLSFVVVAGASGLYLLRGEERWDIVAVASAELGVVLTTLTLITGSLWGRVVWGAWWTWDARLTTTLILWVIYAGYLMLRAYVEDRARRARFAAVLGVVGFIDIPIIHFSVLWWRTLHPQPVVIRPGGPSVDDPRMLQALMVSLLAFTLMYFYLLIQRTRLEQMDRRADGLKQTARA